MWSMTFSLFWAAFSSFYYKCPFCFSISSFSLVSFCFLTLSTLSRCALTLFLFFSISLVLFSSAYSISCFTFVLKFSCWDSICSIFLVTFSFNLFLFSVVLVWELFICVILLASALLSFSLIMSWVRIGAWAASLSFSSLFLRAGLSVLVVLLISTLKDTELAVSFSYWSIMILVKEV